MIVFISRLVRRQEVSFPLSTSAVNTKHVNTPYAAWKPLETLEKLKISSNIDERTPTPPANHQKCFNKQNNTKLIFYYFTIVNQQLRNFFAVCLKHVNSIRKYFRNCCASLSPFRQISTFVDLSAFFGQKPKTARVYCCARRREQFDSSPFVPFSCFRPFCLHKCGRQPTVAAVTTPSHRIYSKSLLCQRVVFK